MNALFKDWKCLDVHTVCTNFGLNVHTVCTNFGLIVHTPVYKIKIRKCMCTFCLSIFMPVRGHCQLGGTFSLFYGCHSIVAADFLTPKNAAECIAAEHFKAVLLQQP